MADAAIDGNQMGADDITDFLTVNLASTDYVGHNFGPNSIEVEDTYLRLDRDLADFFSNLDKKLEKETTLYSFLRIMALHILWALCKHIKCQQASL